ncbi:MAG: hypothetical protein Q9168_008412, partial [Polycauliona sp. 1 TL-2023]
PHDPVVSSTTHSSTTTIQQQPQPTKPSDDESPSEATPRKDSLRPSDGTSRRSQDQHSQPDSDASYDLVSGATSRAPGSPKEEKEKGLVDLKETGKKGESDDDEPDWE